MQIVYEIVVNGVETKIGFRPEEKRVFYPITFKITKTKDRYHVWCCIDSTIPNLYINIVCKSFSTKEQAMSYLRNAAKLAMRGKFLFRICSICKEPSPYIGPKEELIFCPHCQIIFLEEEWQINEQK